MPLKKRKKIEKKKASSFGVIKRAQNYLIESQNSLIWTYIYSKLRP